jgi:1-phosphatidylinositol-3-phosphate 5-kinase
VTLSKKEIADINESPRSIYHFFHDRLDFTVRVFFPAKFEALRKLYCGQYNKVLQSLVKAKVWGEVSGGKTQLPFYMTDDKKYIFKTVKGSEIRMFGDMSNSYFQYLSRSFINQCPTAIAKTLGVFELTIKTYPCKSNDTLIGTQFTDGKQMTSTLNMK